MDPALSGLDRHLDEMEQREATDILEEIANYVEVLQERVQICDQRATGLERRALRGGAGSRHLSESAKIARANALAVHEIMTELRRILNT